MYCLIGTSHAGSVAVQHGGALQAGAAMTRGLLLCMLSLAARHGASAIFVLPASADVWKDGAVRGGSCPRRL
jgi:hypothetical protein